MGILKIMSRCLLLLYEHSEKGETTPLGLFEYFKSDGVYFDKMEAALTDLRDNGIIEFMSMGRSEFYAKIRGKGMFLVEKCNKVETLLCKELEDLFGSAKIINSNVAIHSTNIKQEVSKNDK